MKHYIFIDKNRFYDDMKLYGSIKALVENENLVINDKKQNYRSIQYKLKNDKSYEDKNYLIRQLKVIRKRQVR